MLIDDHNNILAVDPALSTTGYAVINKDTSEIVHVDKITTSPKDPDDTRIDNILVRLSGIIKDYNIHYIILEDGYSGRNIKTAMQLSTLRGAIIGTFNFMGYYVYHMMPTEVRKAIGLSGKANKEEVANKITEIYSNIVDLIGPYSDKQNKSKTSDMYDAISIGLAFITLTRKKE